MKRKPISKKLRFDIFKRDLFTCQYCGSTPPSVVLEVDHITPVASGGGNEIDNLLTACFDCNRGKSAGLLSDIPESLKEKKRVIAEKEEQLKGYNAELRKKKRRIDKTLSRIEEIFNQEYGYLFKESTKETFRNNFFPYMADEELISAILKAAARCESAEDGMRYFCGICWNIRRSREGGKE